MPRTRSTMSRDHRTPGRLIGGPAAGFPGPPIVGFAAGFAGAGAVAYLLPGLAAALPPLRGPLGVGDRTSSGEGCALTFDDGPHAQGTPAVLEALARSGARATFFLVGEQVRRNPSLSREIVAAGHEIGLHCDRHRELLRLTPAQTRADIERAEQAIGEATGLAPALYRPPYGVLNAAALRLA